MKKLLYVDCIMRGERSRTKQLADSFFSELSDNFEVEHLKLLDEPIQSLTPAVLQKRDDLLSVAQLNDKMFCYAHQFADADDVVIAAPFWDLSYPALLKIYVENISVTGITFRYTEKGIEGMCRGKNLIFITTRGGIYQNSSLENGSSYLSSLSDFFGFEQYHLICAEGLDIIGADIPSILDNAKAQVRQLAKAME